MKKIIVYILSISICFMPTLAFSSSNMGGWSLSNPVVQGASVAYQGAKKVIINGKEVIKTGTAKITPPVSSVSKILARGVAGYALSIAVEELLGAVDWVLDPGNNQIKYYGEGVCSKYNCPQLVGSAQIGWFSDRQKACSAAAASYNNGVTSTSHTYDSNFTHCRLTKDGKSWGSVSLTYKANTATEDTRDVKTLPLSTVATQVISNAESKDQAKSVPAQLATTAAAADVVAESETDETKARPIVQQLEQSAVTPTDETSTGTGSQTGTVTDPVTGEPVDTAKPFDFSMEFPVFCGWAPMVCESSQVVIDTPIFIEDYWKNTAKPTLVENWELVRDWATDEPDADAEEVEIEQPEEFDNSVFSKDRFSVSRQCPVPEQHTISLSGISVNFSFDLTPICTVLEFARPALVACSYLYAAYIVIGAARNG